MVIIDLETRSACDLKIEGAWNYAKHPTTRFLTVAWTEYGTGVYHCWLPGLESLRSDYRDVHLPGVSLYCGRDLPGALRGLAGHTWAGHNAFGFDEIVWRELADFEPKAWVDTMCFAQANGLPGGLDAIGKLLWGEGKYEQGQVEAKKAFKAIGLVDCDPSCVPPFRQVLTAKYNVQDVRLTSDLWGVLVKEYRTTRAEADLLAAHKAINERGVRLDFDLWQALHALTTESKSVAVEKIARLTEGVLPNEAAIQSRAKVLAWLTRMGVWEGSSLRKEIVMQYIDENSENEEDEAADVEECKDIQLVVQVLKLRMAALRITGGKLDTAAHVMCSDRQLRGLFGYHKAHTGRFTSMRVQLHNLPRPREGVDTWKLIDLFERTGALHYADVAGCLPLGDPRYPYLSVDDAASALLRSLILPADGFMLATADLAQIEARVLAWLAGEKWLLDLFWQDGDPYIKMATAIMGPPNTWPDYGCPTKKHPYRQIVGKVPELACGYQMGARKLALYAAGLGYDLTEYGTTPERCIQEYRRTHPAIAGEECEWEGHTFFRGGFWDQLNDAAIRAVETGNEYSVGRVAFHTEVGNLICTLPSGRRLVYRQVRLEEQTPFNRPVTVLTYMHPRYKKKTAYGGLLAENIVQATSRDVLGAAIVRCSPDLPVCFHVHDEVGASMLESAYPDFLGRVTTCPDWLQDFPLDAEGGLAPRYAKAPWPGFHEQVWRNGRKHK